MHMFSKIPFNKQTTCFSKIHSVRFPTNRIDPSHKLLCVYFPQCTQSPQSPFADLPPIGAENCLRFWFVYITLWYRVCPHIAISTKQHRHHYHHHNFCFSSFPQPHTRAASLSVYLSVCFHFICVYKSLYKCVYVFVCVRVWLRTLLCVLYKTIKLT